MNNCNCPIRDAAFPPGKEAERPATSRPVVFRPGDVKLVGRGLQRAMDALRKIRLGHPCDVHELIAANAIEEIEEMLA